MIQVVSDFEISLNIKKDKKGERITLTMDLLLSASCVFLCMWCVCLRLYECIFCVCEGVRVFVRKLIHNNVCILLIVLFRVCKRMSCLV